MSTLRIINELTSNSFKHADCNNIYIDIATDDNKLTISYKDDGCGFDFEQIGKVKSNNTGYGIRMLVERVNLLRGSINYNKDEKESPTIGSRSIHSKCEVGKEVRIALE